MRNHTTKAFLLGAMLIASALAHAQYAWIDEKGQRQYSDQPPPTSTPASKMLKAPRGMAPSTTEPAAAAAPAPATKAAPTLAEREADYKKRQAAASESEKKAAAEKKAADNKRANCEAAAQNKTQLDSGRPLLLEGSIMTEDGRKKEQARAAAVLKDCK